MKKNGIVRKATNSFVGRILRRLIGEEKGQAMMEYIVIALLIAAVAVVAVGAFGGAITDLFASLTASVVGRPTPAETSLDTARSNAGSNITSSNGHKTKYLTDAKYTKDGAAATLGGGGGE